MYPGKYRNCLSIFESLKMQIIRASGELICVQPFDQHNISTVCKETIKVLQKWFHPTVQWLLLTARTSAMGREGTFQSWPLGMTPTHLGICSGNWHTNFFTVGSYIFWKAHWSSCFLRRPQKLSKSSPTIWQITNFDSNCTLFFLFKFISWANNSKNCPPNKWP